MSMHGNISPFTSGGSTRRPSFFPVTARSSIFPGSTEASRRNSLSVEKPDLRIVFTNNWQIVSHWRNTGSPDLYLEQNRLSNPFVQGSRLSVGINWKWISKNRSSSTGSQSKQSDNKSRIGEKWVKVGFVPSRDQ